jgi:DNA-binding transcriptional LysR family regulator
LNNREAFLDWNLVRLFVEVVEAGSIAEAARRRGLTRSSVSQRLSQLEQELQAQLLRRTTRQLKPTEIGQTLYEYGRQIAYQFEAAQHDVQSLGTTLGGLVRVSVPPGIGHSYIQPALIEFAAQHPELSLNITFNNRLGDLVDADIDIALRIMQSPPEDLVARELCQVYWQLYCTPRYLQLCGPVNAPDDLRRAAFLTTFGARRTELSFVKDEKAVSVTLAPHLVSESVAFLREAMLGDLGVALLSHYVVRDLLAQGQVVRLLADYQCTMYRGKFYILTVPNRFPTPAMKAVINLLRSTVADAMGTDVPN